MQRPNWLTGTIVISAWLLTIVLGYFGLGGLLQERVEGIDPAQTPLWPTILFGLFALDAIALTIWWAATKPSTTSDTTPTKTVGASTELASGRRRFLTGSAAVTGGIIGAGAANRWAGIRVGNYHGPRTVDAD